MLQHESLAGKVRGLREHEFVSEEARNRFDDLLERLREQLTHQFVDQLSEASESLSDEDRARMAAMLSELNRMLDQRRVGVAPATEKVDFAAFMERYGDFFPESPRTLDELLEVLARRMAAMQQVMNSLSPEQRDQIQDLSNQLLEDLDLQWQV